ncbi:MAG TPA: helix-turn-helix domain-containing protein [Flavipsychrobacter sp.]|nr:helix-turn-helix domain-containing protein [Flavipsychrobacter sp.]
MKVAVLNYEGVVTTSVTGPYDMLAKVGMVSKALNVASKENFEVDIVNSSNLAGNLPFYVVGNKTVNNRKQYDLVLVPAMDFDVIEKTLQNETGLMKWIAKQYHNGADVAAMCMGTFMLAATGLLEGKRATTHWMGAPFFRKLFPGVTLEDAKVIVDEGRLYTSGAAYSFTSLMIYLIEKFGGRDIALAMSKVFMIQVHDTGQNAFSIFNLQHQHGNTEISNVQKHIERNYRSKLSVNGLAEHFNMSERTFIRKFTAFTGNTPLEYIQRVRIEAAKKLLEKGKDTVEEVAHETGYEDFSSFRNIFKRFTGLSPKDYKRKYGEMFRNAIVG